MSSHPIRLSSVDFSWPDGTTVLTGLDLLVPAGRSALVRADGAGKSTMFRLITGEVHPFSGHVSVSGEVGHPRGREP